MKNIVNLRKQEKAITLIALVITIIILLILAGVTIAMLTGENGILRKSRRIKNSNRRKTSRRKIKVSTIRTTS